MTSLPTTVYWETFVLQNVCKFHEFNSFVKIFFANFLQLWAWQIVKQKIQLWVTMWQIVSKKMISSPLDVYTSL